MIGISDKVAEVNLTPYCNFKCGYCISKTEQYSGKPIITNNDGTVKILPKDHDIEFCTDEELAIPNFVLSGDEFMKRLEERKLGHIRDHFLDLKVLMGFIRKHLDKWVIQLTGGEPLRYPAIDSFIIELCKSHRVVLLTNLSLIDDHKDLLSIPNNNLFYRVGYHPESRKYDEFLRHIDILIKANKPYIVNYVLHPKNIENGTYQDHIQLLEKNNIKFQITPFEGVWKDVRYRADGIPMTEEYRILLDRYKVHHSFFAHSPGICGKDSIFIKVDGTIVECAHGTTVLGNIYEDTISRRSICKFNCFWYKHGCPVTIAQELILSKYWIESSYPMARSA